jgi:hypothetical protein
LIYRWECGIGNTWGTESIGKISDSQKHAKKTLGKGRQEEGRKERK